MYITQPLALNDIPIYVPRIPIRKVRPDRNGAQAQGRPALSAQQVRIKVRSAAVNPIDYKLAEFMGQMFFGKAPSVVKPFNVGFDVSGEVVEVGSDVERVKIGAAVYASTPLNDMGTLAEYLVVDEGFVALKPSNLSFNQAAALPTVALTAYAGMTTHAELKKDDAVLILGGSTAVGMFAIQFAHNIGARVITTTSTRNVELVKSMDVLARHSVDVLYDCGVEPSSWNDGAQLVLKKSTGRFITLLPMPEPVKESEFGAQLIGFVSAVDNSAKALEVITKYVEGGKARPVVDSVYPFEKALDAYKKLKTNHAQGKLVVQVHA
ncbi:Zinc-binding dehydrogenase [Phytophthora infestans]|uniref:Zinc-binding dehydrogenase n=1 Tax=Phytophthora infestans TaxID=4787 RepID=A0A833SJS2_PHYIN|nr:Zinc-binding dehydrogenase [Phytophthora infestans]